MLPFSVLWKYYSPGFVIFGRETKVALHEEVRGLFPGKTAVPTSEYRRVIGSFFGKRIDTPSESSFWRTFYWSFLLYLLSVAYIAFSSTVPAD